MIPQFQYILDTFKTYYSIPDNIEIGYGNNNGAHVIIQKKNHENTFDTVFIHTADGHARVEVV